MHLKNIFLTSILLINQFSSGISSSDMSSREEFTSTSSSRLRSIPVSELEYVMRDEKVARVASFDGGGIRGIIPVVWSHYIEEQTYHFSRRLLDEISFILVLFIPPEIFQRRSYLFEAKYVSNPIYNRVNSLFSLRRAFSNIRRLTNSLLQYEWR